MSRYEPVTGNKSGDAITASYAGRYLEFKEELMVHPTRDSGLVVVGDPVLVNGITGRAMSSASSSADIIAIDTEGCYFFDVVLTSGGSVGDGIYISGVNGALSDDSDGWAFGRLLGDADPDADAQTVGVKIYPVLDQGETS